MAAGCDDSDNDYGTGIASTRDPFPGALTLIRIGFGSAK